MPFLNTFEAIKYCTWQLKQTRKKKWTECFSAMIQCRLNRQNCRPRRLTPLVCCRRKNTMHVHHHFLPQHHSTRGSPAPYNLRGFPLDCYLKILCGGCTASCMILLVCMFSEQRFAKKPYGRGWKCFNKLLKSTSALSCGFEESLQRASNTHHSMRRVHQILHLVLKRGKREKK